MVDETRRHQLQVDEVFFLLFMSKTRNNVMQCILNLHCNCTKNQTQSFRLQIQLAGVDYATYK